MRSARRRTVPACAVLFSATAMVLFIICVLQDRPARDLLMLAGFLLASGGITTLASPTLARWPLPSWVWSLRARLVLMCVITAVLGLVNAGFTTALMLLSTRDLALLAGLLGFSLGVSVFVAFAISEPTIKAIGEVLAAVRRLSAGTLDVRVPPCAPGTRWANWPPR